MRSKVEQFYSRMFLCLVAVLKKGTANSAFQIIFILSSPAQPPRVARVSALARFLEEACKPHVLLYVTDT